MLGSYENDIVLITTYHLNKLWKILWKEECSSIDQLLMDSVQINVEKITGSGEAKDVICSIVNKLGADTLVMGSHGYGFFKRYQNTH